MAEQQILAAPQGFGDSQPAMQPAGQMPANAAKQPPQQNGAQQSQLPAAQSVQPAGLPSLREVLAQPLVRRSIPPILALFTLFFFIIIFVSINIILDIFQKPIFTMVEQFRQLFAVVACEFSARCLKCNERVS